MVHSSQLRAYSGRSSGSLPDVTQLWTLRHRDLHFYGLHRRRRSHESGLLVRQKTILQDGKGYVLKQRAFAFSKLYAASWHNSRTTSSLNGDVLLADTDPGAAMKSE